MSWSRGYVGTPAEVSAAAEAAIAEIVEKLPEFEKADVAHVVKAAQCALEAVATDAKVSLSIGGHGYQNTAPAPGDTAASGGLSVSISWSVAAPAAAS